MQFRKRKQDLCRVGFAEVRVQCMFERSRYPCICTIFMECFWDAEVVDACREKISLTELRKFYSELVCDSPQVGWGELEAKNNATFNL